MHWIDGTDRLIDSCTPSEFFSEVIDPCSNKYSSLVLSSKAAGQKSLYRFTVFILYKLSPRNIAQKRVNILKLSRGHLPNPPLRTERCDLIQKILEMKILRLAVRRSPKSLTLNDHRSRPAGKHSIVRRSGPVTQLAKSRPDELFLAQEF